MNNETKTQKSLIQLQMMVSGSVPANAMGYVAALTHQDTISDAVLADTLTQLERYVPELVERYREVVASDATTYEQYVEKTAAAAQAHRQADEHRARSAGAPSIVRDAANRREQTAHAAYTAAMLDAEDFCDANGIARAQLDRDVEFRIGY